MDLYNFFGFLQFYCLKYILVVATGGRKPTSRFFWFFKVIPWLLHTESIIRRWFFSGPCLMMVLIFLVEIIFFIFSGFSFFSIEMVVSEYISINFNFLNLFLHTMNYWGVLSYLTVRWIAVIYVMVLWFYFSDSFLSAASAMLSMEL